MVCGDVIKYSKVHDYYTILGALFTANRIWKYCLEYDACNFDLTGKIVNKLWGSRIRI